MQAGKHLSLDAARSLPPPSLSPAVGKGRGCASKELVHAQRLRLEQRFTRVVVSSLRGRRVGHNAVRLHHLEHRLLSHELVQRFSVGDVRKVGLAVKLRAHGPLEEALERHQVHPALKVLPTF